MEVGTLEVLKLGEDFHEETLTYEGEIPLMGVEFEIIAAKTIKRQDGSILYHEGDLISTKKTDKDGKFSIELPYGEYCVKETVVSFPYQKEEENLCVTLDEKNSKESLTFSNLQKKGKIILEKIDEQTKEVLSGVTFAIYSKEDILGYQGTVLYKKDTYLGTYTTDLQGRISIELPLGSYYLKEIKTQDSYFLEEQPIEVTFDISSSLITTKQIVVTNRLKEGTLKIEKLDSHTRLPIVGVSIEIFREDGSSLGIYETDLEGRIELSLPYGKYLIKEVKAKEGYLLPETLYPVEIKEDVISIKLWNDPIIDVPDTEKNQKSSLSIYGLFFTCLLYCWYEIRH